MKRITVIALVVLAGCSPRQTGRAPAPTGMPPTAPVEAKRALWSTGWRLLESIALVANTKDRNAGVLTFENPYARFYVTEQTVILVDGQTANLEELYHTVLRSKGCLSLKVAHREEDEIAQIVEAISAIRSTPPEKLTRDTTKR